MKFSELATLVIVRDMRFKVYIDFTTEECPRPFYIGKGNSTRVADLKRNRLHTSISNKYGITRQIVFETDDEQEAFAKERELITEHNTCVYIEGSWGANFTMGGEGLSGMKHSEESRRKNSESNRVAQAGERNGMFGRHHSEESRKKIGERSRNQINSDDTRRKKSEAAIRANTGRKLSDETRKKIAESRMGQSPWNKGKKLGTRSKPRVFSEEARLNISEGCKGRIPWNKGKKLKSDESDESTDTCIEDPMKGS